MSAKIIQLDERRRVAEMNKTVKRVAQALTEIRHGNSGPITDQDLTRLLNACKGEDVK